MAKLKLTRNLKNYDGAPMPIEEKFTGLVGDMEGIFQNLENQLNADPQIYTRLGQDSPLPLKPKNGDLMVDFDGSAYRLQIYADGWQPVT